jgi:glycosyltransferase involved in cell wall biosynthesis
MEAQGAQVWQSSLASQPIAPELVLVTEEPVVEVAVEPPAVTVEEDEVAPPFPPPPVVVDADVAPPAPVVAELVLPVEEELAGPELPGPFEPAEALCSPPPLPKTAVALLVQAAGSAAAGRRRIASDGERKWRRVLGSMVVSSLSAYASARRRREALGRVRTLVSAQWTHGERRVCKEKTTARDLVRRAIRSGGSKRRGQLGPRSRGSPMRGRQARGAPRLLLSSRAVTTSVAIEPKGARAAASSRPSAAVAGPAVSIVIPGFNEGDSLRELAKHIREVLEERTAYEIIFVDDGSTDDTWATLGELHREDERIKAVRLRRNFGKAMALSAGFQRARGGVVVTLDADLQDDPADLPAFLARIDEGADVVVGWKVERADPANRRLLSSIFNGAVRWSTGMQLHDMNCGFKAYRREVLRTIPIYGDLFRFIPAFAGWQGFRVAEVPIKHHARKHGQSRYGLERILRGFFDLLSVMFLTRYSRKPMHLFGLVGLVLTCIGMITEGYLTVRWFQGDKIGNRPLLLLGALEIILGIQFFSMGFIGEFLTYQNLRKLDALDLPIREELE